MVGFNTGYFSPKPANNSIISRSGFFKENVEETAFFYRNSFWPRLGNENKFLFMTLSRPANYNGVNNPLKIFDDRDIEVLYIDRVLCRINS